MYILEHVDCLFLCALLQAISLWKCNTLLASCISACTQHALNKPIAIYSLTHEYIDYLLIIRMANYVCSQRETPG